MAPRSELAPNMAPRSEFTPNLAPKKLSVLFFYLEIAPDIWLGAKKALVSRRLLPVLRGSSTFLS